MATAGVAAILAVYRLLGLDLAEVAYCFGFLILVVVAVFGGAAIIASRPQLLAAGFVFAAIVTVTLAVCEVFDVIGAVRVWMPHFHGFLAFVGASTAIVLAAQWLHRSASEASQDDASSFQFEFYRPRWLRCVVILPILAFLLGGLGILLAAFWLPAYGIQSELTMHLAEYHQDPDLGLASHYWPWSFAWMHLGIWPVWLLLIVAGADAIQVRSATISTGEAQMRLARICTAHGLVALTMSVDTLYWFNKSFTASSHDDPYRWMVYTGFESLSLSALLWLPIGAIVVVTLGLLGPHRQELLRVAGWLYALSLLGS